MGQPVHKGGSKAGGSSHVSPDVIVLHGASLLLTFLLLFLLLPVQLVDIGMFAEAAQGCGLGGGRVLALNNNVEGARRQCRLHLAEELALGDDLQIFAQAVVEQPQALEEQLDSFEVVDVASQAVIVHHLDHCGHDTLVLHNVAECDGVFAQLAHPLPDIVVHVVVHTLATGAKLAEHSDRDVTNIVVVIL